MKAALIPPKGYEHTALKSDMHLALPMAELRANPEYVDTYQMARKRGDYVILDNGCAEGDLVSGEVLMAFAKKIGAHEIVAPDVMNEAHLTLGKTVNFLNEFPQAEDYSVMGVVQGREWSERTTLVRAFANLEAITAIGIPKAHVIRSGSTMRLRLAEWIIANFPKRFKIHLLGLSHNYPTEVRDLDFPKGVRSVDSALPYKAAENGMLLNGKRPIPHSKRRSNYFTKPEMVVGDVLEQNIDAFLEWAKHNES